MQYFAHFFAVVAMTVHDNVVQKSLHIGVPKELLMIIFYINTKIILEICKMSKYFNPMHDKHGHKSL